MRRSVLLLIGLGFGVLPSGCDVANRAEDCRDMAAIELALATMLDGQTPDPDPGDLYGGPLDTLRDAKALIRKGNELADRGKTLLDAAERDGKVTVDIRLPRPLSAAASDAVCDGCPGGVCLLPPPLSVQAPPEAAGASTLSPCQGGVCRPRLFGRWRR